jgi:hypothetical protein
MQVDPLGYKTARKVLFDHPREAFFGDIDDLPKHPLKLPDKLREELRRDDLTPQFGYVGERYSKTQVLILGINPGNGDPDARSNADEEMMPALIRFADNPSSPELFDQAQKAYKTGFVKWRGSRHFIDVIGAGKLELEDVAYSNCLPWRTESRAGFAPAVEQNAAKLYACPLIEELKPMLIIAFGKRAEKILRLCRSRAIPPLITWTRARAATPAVRAERDKAAAEIRKAVAGIRTVLGR